MDESRSGEVGRSARFGQEECMKLEQDAMLAEAGAESELITCVNFACTKRLTSEHLWQSTTSPQSTQSGSTST